MMAQANTGFFDALLQQLAYDEKTPMIFSSGLFFWLFAAFMVGYALLQRKNTSRLVYVLAFSYYFYYKSSGTYFFLLALVTCSDFVIANYMGRMKNRVGRKLLVALSLLVDLGILGYFKYTNFLLEILGDLGWEGLHSMDIFLPVGISFFTFQSLSYTIDVYRRKIRPLDSLLDYAFYVSFFPQLVAGPIVRASDFIPQIRRPLTVTREMVGMGFWFIITGLFKKAVISDYIAANFVDRIFADPTLYSGLESLLGVYGYALQIYCDFSGYSDMAIGIALLMGFHFNINFNSPYKAVSITDFWRRWHISLSTWLRDYLYISLGGNRHGKVRQYINLFLTMFLGGLWHGAAWNFVLWGSMHGIALAVHKQWMSVTKGRRWVSTRWWRVASVLLTFHFVLFAWILFRDSTFSLSAFSTTKTSTILSNIFTNFHPELFMGVVEGYWKVLAFIVVGFILHFVPDRAEQRCKTAFVKWPTWTYCVALVLIVIFVIQIKSSDVQPFIYFQF